MRFPRANDLHIDVDKLFNHLVPHNFVHRFPKPIAHFLGYREKPRKNIGNVLVGCWALLGTFVGIIIIEAVFLIPEIRRHGPPLLIGSFVRFSLHLKQSNADTRAGRCGRFGIQHH